MSVFTRGLLLYSQVERLIEKDVEDVEKEVGSLQKKLASFFKSGK